MIDQKIYNLTVSCGVTLLKEQDNYDSIIDRVGTALSKAKKGKVKTLLNL